MANANEDIGFCGMTKEVGTATEVGNTLVFGLSADIGGSSIVEVHRHNLHGVEFVAQEGLAIWCHCVGDVHPVLLWFESVSAFEPQLDTTIFADGNSVLCSVEVETAHVECAVEHGHEEQTLFVCVVWVGEEHEPWVFWSLCVDFDFGVREDVAEVADVLHGPTCSGSVSKKDSAVVHTVVVDMARAEVAGRFADGKDEATTVRCGHNGRIHEGGIRQRVARLKVELLHVKREGCVCADEQFIETADAQALGNFVAAACWG